MSDRPTTTAPSRAELLRALSDLRRAQGNLEAALAGRVPPATAWRRVRGAAASVLQLGQAEQAGGEG